MSAPGTAVVAVVGALILAGCGGGGSSSVPSNAPPGAKVFAESCATCHTLSAARASGTVGPDLDHKGLSTAAVAGKVRDGAAGMPSFSGQLSDTEISQVSQFVAQSSR